MLKRLYNATIQPEAEYIIQVPDFDMFLQHSLPANMAFQITRYRTNKNRNKPLIIKHLNKNIPCAEILFNKKCANIKRHQGG